MYIPTLPNTKGNILPLALSLGPLVDQEEVEALAGGDASGRVQR